MKRSYYGLIDGLCKTSLFVHTAFGWGKVRKILNSDGVVLWLVCADHTFCSLLPCPFSDAPGTTPRLVVVHVLLFFSCSVAGSKSSRSRLES